MIGYGTQLSYGRLYSKNTVSSKFGIETINNVLVINRYCSEIAENKLRYRFDQTCWNSTFYFSQLQ